MRSFVAIVFLLVGFEAAAQRRPNNNFGWGAGAFNTNYRPAGSTVAATPNWRALSPSWRGGVLSYPNQRGAVGYVSPYAYSPYGYGYGYGYGAPYGSSYYGFQHPEQEEQPQQPTVVVFEHPQPPAPPPQVVEQPAPAPQVIIVQVPVPTPAPVPVVAPQPEPVGPKTPPREVYRWLDADGVTHYSTNVPPGVKADKVGPK